MKRARGASFFTYVECTCIACSPGKTRGRGVTSRPSSVELRRGPYSVTNETSAPSESPAGGVAFGPERLSERETEQRIRGVGRDVTSEKFGTGHAQAFGFAEDRRKITIESPGRRTSIE